MALSLPHSLSLSPSLTLSLSLVGVQSKVMLRGLVCVRRPTDCAACGLDGAYGALRRSTAARSGGGSIFWLLLLSCLVSCGPSAGDYLHILTGVLSDMCAGTPLPFFVYMHVMSVLFVLLSLFFYGARRRLRRSTALGSATQRRGLDFFGCCCFSCLVSCGPSAGDDLHILTGVFSCICAGTPLPRSSTYMCCCAVFCPVVPFLRRWAALVSSGAQRRERGGLRPLKYSGYVVARQVSA